MQLGMIGLGRDGREHGAPSPARRPRVCRMPPQSRRGGGVGLGRRAGRCVADRTGVEAQQAAGRVADGARGRVEASIEDLVPLLEPDDILIDGGNSYYVDDIRRAGALAAKGLRYVDVGTSGGVWGLERGYCMMIGGEPAIVQHLDPLFVSLAPGIGNIPRTPGRDRPAAPPSRATCTAGPTAPGTSSRWCTTASSTA